MESEDVNGANLSFDVELKQAHTLLYHYKQKVATIILPIMYVTLYFSKCYYATLILFLMTKFKNVPAYTNHILKHCFQTRKEQ